MVTLVLTDMGRDTIKCAATSPGQNDFHLSVIRYSGYVYFLLKFLDFGRIVFAVLRRKRHQATVFAFLQCCLVIMLVQSGVYFSPDGIVLFIAIVDTVLGCFINSYYILAAAKYFHDVLYWKRRLVFFQMLGYLTLVFHSCYFLIQPSCQHHRLVLYVQGIYGGSCFLFSGLRFLSLLLKKTSFIRLPNSEKNRNNLKVHWDQVHNQILEYAVNPFGVRNPKVVYNVRTNIAKIVSWKEILEGEIENKVEKL